MAEIFVNNDGVTPAYQVDFGGSIRAMTQDAFLNIISRAPRKVDGHDIEGTVLNGGVSERREVRGNVGPDTLRLIEQGRLNLYIFGLANYTDTFGDSWRTEFCYELTRVEFGDHKANPGKITWPGAPFHNVST
ncbi:hypothetical protein [Sphingobium terrigena]|uniref:hypothetical protein n=1 Tax=Sphingobium terrigena TaxID=2304063 RepID=UPI0011C39FDD|nr:hypothetical protein [Sphingobium terrigena]